MKLLYNSYQRMQKYYIYFSNTDFTLDETHEYGCSMSALKKHLTIPLTVIRRDISVLFSMPECGYLYFDFGDESENNIINSSSFCKEIISGKYDNIPIVSALPFRYVDSEIPIVVKPTEMAVLSRYASQQNHIQNNPILNYYIKQSYRFQETSTLSNKLYYLNYAINKTCAVMIRYHDSQKKALNLEIYPLKLLYDSTENIYAVVAAYDHFSYLYTYRLDRMVYVSVINNKTWEPKNNKYRNLLNKLHAAPYVWDRNFNTIHLEHVKVCFLVP